MLGAIAARNHRPASPSFVTTAQVLGAIAARRDAGVDAELSVAYVEVFGSQVTDTS